MAVNVSFAVSLCVLAVLSLLTSDRRAQKDRDNAPLYMRI